MPVAVAQSGYGEGVFAKAVGWFPVISITLALSSKSLCLFDFPAASLALPMSCCHPPWAVAAGTAVCVSRHWTQLTGTETEISSTHGMDTQHFDVEQSAAAMAHSVKRTTLLTPFGHLFIGGKRRKEN